MALRNYLYAKHLDPQQAALISTETMLTNGPDGPRKSCGSSKELVLENGTLVCANCSDCPKKTTPAADKPLVQVNFEEVSFN